MRDTTGYRLVDVPEGERGRWGCWVCETPDDAQATRLIETDGGTRMGVCDRHANDRDIADSLAEGWE